MNEDPVVRAAVDFIRSSSKNLDLALQIEGAMPRLRADLIKEFLEILESTMSTDEWRWHGSDAGLFKKYARLALRRTDWPTDQDPEDQTGIVLGTDKALWGQVYVGVYFSENARQRIRANEQEILPRLRRVSDELPRGSSWRTHEFPPELLGDWNGYATYRYLDDPVGDWGSARFLRDSLDGHRKEEMVGHVVKWMEYLKRGASAIVEATLRTT